MQETVDLKQRLRGQEIESENIKARDNLAAQKNLAEARNAYDRLLTDKTELEIRVARMVDRTREGQNQAEELRRQTVEMQAAKLSGLSRVEELDFTLKSLDAQLVQLQDKEQGRTIIYLYCLY